MAMGAGIGGAVLTIVTEKMAAKTFRQEACRGRTESSRMRKDLSGRGENLSAIRESNMLSRVPGDWEGVVFLISGVIVGCRRVYCGGRGGSHQR